MRIPLGRELIWSILREFTAEWIKWKIGKYGYITEKMDKYWDQSEDKEVSKGPI